MRQAGFTLIELMVSTAIILVITGVMFANQNRYNEGVDLNNVAYQMAQITRQSQAYGIAARQFGGRTDRAYGVHFSTATPGSFVLFADLDGNNAYTDQSEIVESFTLSRNNVISSFCGVKAGPVDVCSPTISYLDVLFYRPKPEAYIYSSLIADGRYQTARITLRSPNGTTRIVLIQLSGQVAIQ